MIIVVDSSKPDGIKSAKRWADEFIKRAPIASGEETRRFCWLCVGAKADLRQDGKSMGITEAIAELTDILGYPASEVKPTPSAAEPAEPGLGDEPPAKPQDVLSRKLPDQQHSRPTPPDTPPAVARRSFWGSLRLKGEDASSVSRLSKRRSLHNIYAPSIGDSASHKQRPSKPTGTSRDRLESTATIASSLSIYHTPQGSTIFGSSPAAQSHSRTRTASSNLPVKGTESTGESNRSSVATVTAQAKTTQLIVDESPAERSDAETEESSMPRKKRISIGDHLMNQLVELERTPDSSMPPMLSGDPIPFPKFTEELPVTPSRRDRNKSIDRRNRISRALTLDEVDPDELDEEEPEANNDQEEESTALDLGRAEPELQEGFDFILTSSKTGQNVELVFKHVVNRVAARWRCEELEEERAKRAWILKHQDASSSEIDAMWQRAKEEDPALLSMSVIERDREAIRRGIRVAAGKDPNLRRGGLWACCLG